MLVHLRVDVRHELVTQWAEGEQAHRLSKPRRDLAHRRRMECRRSPQGNNALRACVLERTTGALELVAWARDHDLARRVVVCHADRGAADRARYHLCVEAAERAPPAI